MNKTAIQNLVTQTKINSERASEYIAIENYEAAQQEMKIISDKYMAFCDELADEAANEQKDDAEEKESTDNKGYVPDSPHDGYVPGS